MSEQLSKSQAGYIQSLHEAQVTLRYIGFARYFFPLMVIVGEIGIHYISENRSIILSVVLVAFIIYFYTNFRSRHRSRILSKTRADLYSPDCGQAIAIYTEQKPHAFRYLFRQLNEEFGMELKT